MLVAGIVPAVGIEIKLSNAPKITKGTTIASQDFGDMPIYVVTHSTTEDYAYSDTVTVTSFERILLILREKGLLLAH